MVKQSLLFLDQLSVFLQGLSDRGQFAPKVLMLVFIASLNLGMVQFQVVDLVTQTLIQICGFFLKVGINLVEPHTSGLNIADIGL